MSETVNTASIIDGKAYAEGLRGRVATLAAWRHLGLAPPARATDLFD